MARTRITRIVKKPSIWYIFAPALLTMLSHKQAMFNDFFGPIF